MIERFAQFPRALAERARVTRFGDVPVLLAHPDWDSAVPTILWLHGRTVNKELDPGRYLRWLRAGMAACAIDLPGHGERTVAAMQEPTGTMDVLTQAVGEIDGIVEHLAGREWGGVFDLDRLAIGGMSAGGMVTLRRLCDPHPFVCASVEGTTGWLEGLYFAADGHTRVGAARHARKRVLAVDTAPHLSTFRPMPLLALHSEADEVVPWSVQQQFLTRLREHYTQVGADPRLVEAKTWPTTGAPQEHSGFGRAANEAKNVQVEFFAKWLRASRVGDDF
ncbi:MAG TPA: prolyl oligopeptidase family serine peptidase [Phycisphaerales bacterium]|nr:prolyl oligopeptidase family serine peptidase [Phycisphaerales bacterium]